MVGNAILVSINHKGETAVEKLKKLWKILTAPEMLAYLVFGVLTTLINIVSFSILRDTFQVELLAANTLAWVISVAFAFVTNKLFVFQSKSFAPALLLKELVSFVAARLLSLGVDTAGMWLLVSVLQANELLSKIWMNVLVVVINYVLSKWFIFKKKPDVR